jgi:transcriptional regulator with XRE-family HTH domain
MDPKPDAAELMRQARISRGLTLADLARTTCIDSRMLNHIEHGRFDQLPAGLYARAWVRTYASAVGLDPREVFGLVEAELPRVDSTLEEIVETRERASLRGAMSLTCRRSAAAVVDATVLCGVDLMFVLLGAAACGVTLRQFIDAAVLPFLLLFVIVALAYFAILGGLGGRTLGGMIFEVPAEPLPGPRDLLGAGRRAARCFLAEASLLIAWMGRDFLSQNR